VRSVRSRIATVVWLLVGVLVASVHHYFSHIGTLRLIISALLAIVLWPLLLVGVNLHVK
jgi:FtsH-binding integral membrane protein